ncbi:hypothetical protein GGF31_008815 [Allomyces arbusculus]|nr:hypothetical protein GGF31_008815 [Allomyces arbusculus]
MDRDRDLQADGGHYDGPFSEHRRRLPVFKHRNQLLYLVEKYQVVIVVGATGSGKSTQIPQFLHEAGWTSNGRLIGCTQPRRIAATSLAKRVAAELGEPLGQSVGYAIRFDDTTDATTTRIKYMTEGMLLREIMVDPLLSRYNVVMVDEAHERSLAADMVLGLLKLIMTHRADLRVIISSATLDALTVRGYFQDSHDHQVAELISLDGQMYPLDIHYLTSPCDDYVAATVKTVAKIHVEEPPGDVLVFLTGREEIELTVQALRELPARAGTHDGLMIMPVPIFGGLTQDQQHQAFEPTPRGFRKVIVATQIAEASVTIDGIVYVVDCGFVKVRTFLRRTGRDALWVVPISKASANQRAGRAGRTRPGKVYRLYSPAAFAKLPDVTQPEILRVSLTSTVLLLKYLGVHHVGAFPFLSTPPRDNFAQALTMLHTMGAMSDTGELTVLGQRMAELPVDPPLAAVIMHASDMGCLKEILPIVAMLSIESIFVSVRGEDDALFKQIEFAVEEGDHISYLNVFLAFQAAKESSSWCHKHRLNYQSLTTAARIHRQLTKFLAKYDLPLTSCDGDSEIIRKCLLRGFFANAAAVNPDGSYRSLRDGSALWIHPSSALFERAPAYIMYHELLETNRAYMRHVTVVDHRWLAEAAPNYYEYKDRQ